ncbi:MAG: nitroreductase family protein, partial [Actinobacteria bacterium]|nr:nitroreductase family protein [Actinomycetota bacterium]
MGGDALEVIRARRSIGRLTEPAPSEEELRQILEAGAAAPDHGELMPWRFIVLRGDAKDAFGEVLVDAYVARVQAVGGE